MRFHCSLTVTGILLAGAGIGAAQTAPAPAKPATPASQTATPPAKPAAAPTDYPPRLDASLCLPAMRLTGSLGARADKLDVEINYQAANSGVEITADGLFTIALVHDLQPGFAVKITPSLKGKAGTSKIFSLPACSASGAGGSASNALGAAQDSTSQAAPVPDAVFAGDTKITGRVFGNTGNVDIWFSTDATKPASPSVKPKADGTFSIPLPASHPAFLVNESFRIVQDKGKDSAPQVVKSRPTIQAVMTGDKDAKGSAGTGAKFVKLCKAEDATCRASSASSSDTTVTSGKFDISGTTVSALQANDDILVVQDDGTESAIIKVHSKPTVNTVFSGDSNVTGKAANGVANVKLCRAEDSTCRSQAAASTDTTATSGSFTIDISKLSPPLKAKDEFVVVQSDSIQSDTGKVYVKPSVDAVKAGVNKVGGIVLDGSKFVTVCNVEDSTCRKSPVTQTPDPTVKAVISAAVGADGKFKIAVTDTNGKPVFFKENQGFVVVEDTALGGSSYVESGIQKTVAADLKADINTDLVEGGKVVQGDAAGASNVEVKVLAPASTTTAVIPLDATGSFAATLDLKGATTISGKLPVDASAKTPLQTVSLTIRAAENADDTPPRNLKIFPKVNGDFSTSLADAGTTNITGIAMGAKTVTITTEQTARVVEKVSVPVDSTTNKYTAALGQVLVENETVTATPYVADSSGGRVNGTTTSPEDVRSSEYDWGRVRAYFSLGVNTTKGLDSSGKDTSFNNYHPYLSLNVDYNWGLWNKGGWYTAFNTFMEARLTNTPTLQFGTNTSNGTPSTLQTLASAPKTFAGEFGAYLPINSRLMTWHFGGKRQVLFFAPLFKAGASTVPTGGIPDPSNVDKFISGGVRIGHYYQPKKSHDVAGQLISYLDATIGRWDYLRDTVNSRFTGPNASCSTATPSPAMPSTNSIDCYRVPLRFQLTGRLKIPVTPFTIGFNSISGPGPDILEIFLGVRVDAASMLEKLVPALTK